MIAVEGGITDHHCGGRHDTEGSTIASEGDIIPLKGGMIAAEGDMIASEGRIVPSEGGIIAAESGIIASEGEIIALMGGIIASKSGIAASEGGMIAVEGGITASEGGMIAAEGSIVVSEGGIMASVGGLAPSEGGVMHLEGDITSFAGCKTTILPNLQAPSAPGNPLSRRRGALALEGAISICRGLWPPWPPPWIRACYRLRSPGANSFPDYLPDKRQVRTGTFWRKINKNVCFYTK